MAATEPPYDCKLCPEGKDECNLSFEIKIIIEIFLFVSDPSNWLLVDRHFKDELKHLGGLRMIKPIVSTMHRIREHYEYLEAKERAEKEAEKRAK